MIDNITFNMSHFLKKRCKANDKGECIGIGDTLIDDICKLEKNKSKLWINKWVHIDYDENKKINFIEYMPLNRSSLKFNNYCLLEKQLRTDIKFLKDFSPCVIKSDTYYFPTINLCIWTNKNIYQPGYSVSIYKKEYIKEFTKDIMDKINNLKINETLILD